MAPIVAIALSLLAAACGSGDTETLELDPAVAEEVIADKARADIGSNPAFVPVDVEDPQVQCSERAPNESLPEDATLFGCEVQIVDADGKRIGSQEWEALVELDPQTSDAIVRGARRVETTIPPAPRP
jgi:hypothetical protein